MKRNRVVKSNIVLSLVAITVLFLLVGCGSDPQQKSADPDKGQYALDFNACTSGLDDCLAAFESATFDEADYSIGDTELTVEAWVKKSQATAMNGTLLTRLESGSGMELYVENDTPKFKIRRLPGATGTVDYVVDSGHTLVQNSWTHVAGVLVNEAHTHTATASCTATVMAETPHLDIYVDGVFQDCATTWGDASDTLATGPSFAMNPSGHALAVGGAPMDGMVDEVRLWTVARTTAQLTACMDVELGTSGACARTTDDLIAYLRFNEGEGHSVTDWAGLGGGGAEYPDATDLEDGFASWDDGWTTDTPFTD